MVEYCSAVLLEYIRNCTKMKKSKMRVPPLPTRYGRLSSMSAGSSAHSSADEKYVRLPRTAKINRLIDSPATDLRCHYIKE